MELHRSERISDSFGRVMTESRLGLLADPDPAGFHGRFPARNRVLYDHMAAGELAAARRGLARYLDDAEQDVAAAVAAGGKVGA